MDLLEGIGEFIDSGAVDAVGVADELPADLEAAEAHGELGDADPSTAGAANACWWAKAWTAPACAPPSANWARPAW
ncbi:hypothetical protein [Arenimonas daejeonensis]|uniref:hypothetical protein n=1 Tax=Arenimonas daejeonensis TaxID=370777 RepID=UPI001D133844|nr:hypothetical protein [Arenimonas daejeonensis]